MSLSLDTVLQVVDLVQKAIDIYQRIKDGPEQMTKIGRRMERLHTLLLRLEQHLRSHAKHALASLRKAQTADLLAIIADTRADCEKVYALFHKWDNDVGPWGLQWRFSPFAQALFTLGPSSDKLEALVVDIEEHRRDIDVYLGLIGVQGAQDNYTGIKRLQADNAALKKQLQADNAAMKAQIALIQEMLTTPPPTVVGVSQGLVEGGIEEKIKGKDAKDTASDKRLAGKKEPTKGEVKGKEKETQTTKAKDIVESAAEKKPAEKGEVAKADVKGKGKGTQTAKENDPKVAVATKKLTEKKLEVAKKLEDTPEDKRETAKKLADKKSEVKTEAGLNGAAKAGAAKGKEKEKESVKGKDDKGAVPDKKPPEAKTEAKGNENPKQSGGKDTPTVKGKDQGKDKGNQTLSIQPRPRVPSLSPGPSRHDYNIIFVDPYNIGRSVVASAATRLLGEHTKSTGGDWRLNTISSAGFFVRYQDDEEIGSLDFAFKSYQQPMQGKRQKPKKVALAALFDNKSYPFPFKAEVQAAIERRQSSGLGRELFQQYDFILVFTAREHDNMIALRKALVAKDGQKAAPKGSGRVVHIGRYLSPNGVPTEIVDAKKGKDGEDSRENWNSKVAQIKRAIKGFLSHEMGWVQPDAKSSIV